MADKDTVQEKAASKVFVELEVQKVLTAVEAVRTDVAQSERRLTDKICNSMRWVIGVGLTAIGLLIAILWRMPGGG